MAIPRNSLFAVLVCLVSGSIALAACPSADLSGDCRVDLDDLTIMASEWLTVYDCNDLTAMASEWLDELHPDPNDMVCVYINDPGTCNGDNSFIGLMSKYETTNAQYCNFLNAALASGDITVSDNYVYGANGSNSGADFVDEIYFRCNRQIAWDSMNFNVCVRDGYDMSNHPVVDVTWYGAVAFCNYYGYRLPTETEWEAVADYDGSFIYGCGETIDYNKANYDWINPLGLSDYPYTAPVGYYSPYGYDMYDMAGNVWEWTSTVYKWSPVYRIFRGGGYDSIEEYCEVTATCCYIGAGDRRNYLGFRVCR